MLTVPVVHSHDHLRGVPHAAVTLVEYGDYQCPYCAMVQGVVNQVRAHFRDRLCFAYRHFPLTTVHPRAEISAEAAEAAGAQGRFWDMHNTLYLNQAFLQDVCLAAYAQQLGLDFAQFQGDLAKHRYTAKVRDQLISGVRSGVNGTPTFFINGIRHDGAWDLSSLTEAVHRVMQSAAVR
jgi:protein-disulfide isomerase